MSAPRILDTFLIQRSFNNQTDPETKPFDAHCWVDILIDDDEVTPTSAKIGFQAHDWTESFSLPLHVFLECPAGNPETPGRYLRLLDSLGDDIYSKKRPLGTGSTVWTYVTGDGYWWEYKDPYGNSNNDVPAAPRIQLTTTKEGKAEEWVLPTTHISTNFDSKTANSFFTCYDTRAKNEIIIDYEAYSSVAQVFTEIANKLNTRFGTSLKTETDVKNYLNNYNGTYTIDFFLVNVNTAIAASKGYNSAYVTSALNSIFLSKPTKVIVRDDQDTRNPWRLIYDFDTLQLFDDDHRLSYSASDAKAAALNGNASIAITDNGNNTYSFTVNTTVSAGAVGNKKTYHPLKSEKITYQVWENGESSTQTLYLPEINHTLSLQPTGENRTLGPYGPYKWQPKNTNDTNKAIVIYEAKGIYDTAVSKRYSSNLAIKNYIAPSSPNVEDAFYYFTNSSVPRPYSKLSFVWQTATASNTVSPVKGYRIAIYTKQKSKGETSFSRLANLGCSLVLRSTVNTASLEIYYCEPDDPLRTSSQASLPDIRDDANGFIYSDNFFAEDVNNYNIPIPTESAGKRLNADGEAESINFIGNYYNKDKTWRGVTIDLDSFPEEKRLDTGDELYIRVTAYSRNESGNGAGDLLKSTWDSTQSPVTEGAPVPAVGGSSKAADPIEIMQATAVMRPKVSGSWKEGNVWVKVDGTWKEAEAVYVRQDGAWKESQ